MDSLFSIDSASLSGYGDGQIVSFINSLGGTDLTTAKGKSINNDFDYVTKPATVSYGLYKTRTADNYIDLLVTIWRTNKNISTSDGSGSTNVSPTTTAIKGKAGYMAVCRNLDYTGMRYGLVRHEFAHTLFGGNDFHTCGPGAGEKTFIGNTGGYSCLGSWDNTYNGFNAWDRNRIGSTSLLPPICFGPVLRYSPRQILGYPLPHHKYLAAGCRCNRGYHVTRATPAKARFSSILTIKS